MMTTWILLLRGINVGGTGKLPMKDLVSILESLGYENVRTYIQSGNAVFEGSGAMGDDAAGRIAAVIESSHGFKPEAMLLSAEQLKRAAASNPFPEAEREPKTLHLFFLAATPASPDVATLDDAKSPSERFHLAGGVLYLHAPDGIGRSKLAAKAERILGVPTTSRNWNTVTKLLEMTRT